MFTYFSYTECESAGPYDKTPGYKVKSAITLDSDLQTEIETVNRAIAAFPNYTPPKLDIFTSNEEFLSLDKNWSYSPIGGGSLAFYRLFTSGMARGRPGNPFHQVVTVDFEKFLQIHDFLTSKNGNSRFVPADFFFWSGWISPRGDEEVENSQTSDAGMPTPIVSENELIERFEAKLVEGDLLNQLAVFEQSYRNEDTGFLPTGSDDLFFENLSVLTRLFPLTGAWVVPFSNHPNSLRFSSAGNDSKPVYKANPSTESASGSTWTKSLALASENGLMASVFEATKELDSLLSPGFGNQRNLAHLPLSLLICGHDIISFDDRYVVQELADYCQDALPGIRFRGEEAKSKAISNLDDSFARSLLTDEQADLIYGIVSQLPVTN